MYTVLFVVVAYLLGSISFALVSSKLFGLADPRTYGSKNPGATNVLRSGNKLAALLTLVGDAAKGWLAVWLAFRRSIRSVKSDLPVFAWPYSSATCFPYSRNSRAEKAWRPRWASCWESVRYWDYWCS